MAGGPDEGSEAERVLIVDDDALVARSVAGFLGTHSFFTRVAHNVADAVGALRSAMAAGQPFDGLVLDLDLKGERGEDVLDFADHLPFRPRILVFSGAIDINERALAVQDRAAFLQKPVQGAHVLAALAPRPSPFRLFAKRYRLASREFDVLVGVANGLTDEQIGESLDLAYGTVRCHIDRAAAKVRVKGRTALLAAALRFVEERASGSFPAVVVVTRPSGDAD